MVSGVNSQDTISSRKMRDPQVQFSSAGHALSYVHSPGHHGNYIGVATADAAAIQKWLTADGTLKGEASEGEREKRRGVRKLRRLWSG